jgi:hypothetical protein
MSFLHIAQSLDPFMDKDGETFIHVQIEGTDGFEPIALDTPWGRKIVRSLLCPIFPKGFATDHETRVALEVIEAFAFQRPRRQANANVDQEIARKPLAKAVLAIARAGGTKKGLSQLLAMLLRTAQREDIDLKKGPWPPNVDALGKQLSLLIELMLKKGVTLTRHETERPRTWSISALLDGSDERDGNVADASHGSAPTNGKPDTSPPVSTDLAELTDDDIMAQLNGDQQ